MGQIVGSVIGAVSGASKDMQEAGQAKQRAELEAERTALSPYFQKIDIGQTYQAPSGDNTLLGMVAGSQFGKQFGGNQQNKEPEYTSSGPGPAVGGSVYGSTSGSVGTTTPMKPGQDIEPMPS